MSKDLPLFYVPELNSERFQYLVGDEATHGIRVLRLEVDDEILITDGRGRMSSGVIASKSKRSLDFELLEDLEPEHKEPGFHLAIAPTKNMDRLEFCVEKCIEIGLGKLSLVICQNSERRQVRVDRLQKIAISAMKQSRAAFLPDISEPLPISDFISHERSEDLFIAHCRTGEREFLKSNSSPACLLIGPEGDFTESEIEEAVANGAKPVHLGPKRLRTETAAIVGCTLMNL
ncbi:MAG: 16S rRNA (uracil(1498)-N(3))-methyltransferase [Flavobacteriales bacterium]|nr:16S rRNA (uracil(1498)-N(3))-methyltransferase [Flavobacteriales bacterium]